MTRWTYLLGAEAIDEAYEHDYAVCARARLYELHDVLTVFGDGRWWWVANTIDPASGGSEAQPLPSVDLEIDRVVFLGPAEAATGFK